MKELLELIANRKQEILIPGVYEFLLWKKDKKDDGYIHTPTCAHPSKCSSLCPRKNYIAREFVIDRKRTKRDAFALVVGDAVHEAVQKLLADAGILTASEVPGVNVEVEMHGHADGIVIINGEQYVLEIKTTSERWFKEYSKKPFAPHVRQVTLYMWMLGIKKAIILYVHKDTGDMAEHVVEYDQSVVDGVLSKVSDDRKYKLLDELPPYYCHTEAADQWCPVWRYDWGKTCSALTNENWREQLLGIKLTKKKTDE